MSQMGLIGWRPLGPAQQDDGKSPGLSGRGKQNRAAGPSLLPQAVAQACEDKFLLKSPGGWMLDEYNCYANQVTYSWSRAQSTIDYLLQQVPHAEVELSGNKASYLEHLNLKTGKDEALLNTNDLLRPLQSKMQLLGLALKVNPPLPPPPLPGRSRSAPKLTALTSSSWARPR